MCILHSSYVHWVIIFFSLSLAQTLGELYPRKKGLYTSSIQHMTGKIGPSLSRKQKASKYNLVRNTARQNIWPWMEEKMSRKESHNGPLVRYFAKKKVLLTYQSLKMALKIFTLVTSNDLSANVQKFSAYAMLQEHLAKLKPEKESNRWIEIDPKMQKGKRAFNRRMRSHSMTDTTSNTNMLNHSRGKWSIDSFSQHCICS